VVVGLIGRNILNVERKMIALFFSFPGPKGWKKTVLLKEEFDCSRSGLILAPFRDGGKTKSGKTVFIKK